MAGKDGAQWAGGTQTLVPTHDYALPGVTDPDGTKADAQLGRPAVNNTYPLAITTTVALDHETHCGRHLYLTGSGTITIDVDNLQPGFTCVLENLKGSTYTFPTPTGTGAATRGPANGNTAVADNGLVTILVRGNTVVWKGESA